MPEPEDESNPADVAELNKKIESKLEELQRLDLRQEQYLAGFTEFLEHLADSSATPCLSKFFDPQKIELVGATGRYGYVFRSDSTKGHLIKAIHPRWVSLAAREWMHGHSVGHHDHIVHYHNVFLHRDVDEEFASRVRDAFDAGTLTGQCPQAFPEYYFCVVVEHMDSGTVQSLLNRGLLPVGGIAEVCRSVAAGLAYMHKMKRTHNDIRPDNVLLKSTPGSNRLIAKLADLGWAEHSTDRDRDNELFAYTIWCMGLNKKFRKVPALPSERQAAVADLRKCGSECKDGKGELWEQLAQIADGLWKQDLNMCQVRDWPELQCHEITKPCNEEVLEQLKESATKNAMSKKKSIVLQGRVERLPVSDSSRASVIQATDQDDMEDDDEHDSFRSISPYGRAASANSRYSPNGDGSSSMMMESERLQKLLDEKSRDLLRLDSQFENEIEGYTQFLKSLTETSAADLLNSVVDCDHLEVLGRGNYGFVFSTMRRTTGERVVLKVQSPRWVSVCLQEWMHGSQVGHHANIVEHQCVLMHRDLGGNIESWIVDAFSTGILSGKMPKSFPDTFVCIILEYMDRGTVQSLMDAQLLVLEGVAAVTRSVASALGYMHSKGLTHNDIKPENILLKRDQHGQHLVPKLADLGLAQHSNDQTRDREQFAYTIWCMGLNKKFTKVPTITMHESFLAEFRAMSESQSLNKELLGSLSEALEGIWRGQCVRELADWPIFQGCQVQEPRSEAARKTLELGAKKETARRSLLIPSYAEVAAMAANKMESQSKVAASRPPPEAIHDCVEELEQSALKIQKIYRGKRASVPEEAVFDAIDTDHDNVISRDEYGQAVKSGIIVEDAERAQEVVMPEDASTPSGFATQGRMQTEVETPPLSAAAATAASDCLLPREDREDETCQKTPFKESASPPTPSSEKPPFKESASPPTPSSEIKLEDGSLPPDDMLPNIDSINEVLEDPSQEPWAGDDISVKASDPPSIHGDVSEPPATSVDAGIQQQDLDQWSTADVNSTEHVANLAHNAENLHGCEADGVQGAECINSVQLQTEIDLLQTETELFQTEIQRYLSNDATNFDAPANHLVNDDAITSQMGMPGPEDTSATISNDIAIACEQNGMQSARDDQRSSGPGVNAEQSAAAPTGQFESNNCNGTGASMGQANNLQNPVVASVDNVISMSSSNQPGAQVMQLCPREEEELNHLLQHRQMIPGFMTSGSLYSGMGQHPIAASETLTPFGTSAEFRETLTSLAVSAEPQEDCQQTHGAAETFSGDPSTATDVVASGRCLERSGLNAGSDDQQTHQAAQTSLGDPSTMMNVPASGKCLDRSELNAGSDDQPKHGAAETLLGDPSTMMNVPASGRCLDRSELNAGSDDQQKYGAAVFSLGDPSTMMNGPASGRCLDSSELNAGSNDQPKHGAAETSFGDPSTMMNGPASGRCLDRSELNAGSDDAALSKLELELGPPIFTESLSDSSTSRELRDQYDKILSIYESLCLPGNDSQKEEVDQLRKEFNEMSSSSDSAKSDPKHEVVLLTNQLMGRNGEFDVSDSLQVSETSSTALSVDVLRQRYDELVSRFESPSVIGSKDNTFALSDLLAAEMGRAAEQNAYQHESLVPGEVTLPASCAPASQNSNQGESFLLNDATLPSVCAPAEHNVAQAASLAPSEVTIAPRYAPAEQGGIQNELLSASDVTPSANLQPADHNAAQMLSLLAELNLEEPVSNLMTAAQAGPTPTMGPSSSAGREVAQTDVKQDQVAAGVSVPSSSAGREVAPNDVKQDNVAAGVTVTSSSAGREVAQNDVKQDQMAAGVSVDRGRKRPETDDVKQDRVAAGVGVTSSSAGRGAAQNDVKQDQMAAGVSVDRARKRPETAPAQAKSQRSSNEASRALLDDLRDWSVLHGATLPRAASPVDCLSADELRQRYDQITLKLEPLFTSVSSSNDVDIRQRQQEFVRAVDRNAEAVNLEPCNSESLADPSIFLPRERDSSRRSSSSHSLNFDELRRRYEEIVLNFVPENNHPAGGRNDQAASFALNSAQNSYANQACSSSNGPALDEAHGFDRLPLAVSGRSDQNSGLREEGPGVVSAAAVQSTANNTVDHGNVQNDLCEPGPALRAALSANETSVPRLQRDNFVAPLSAETTTGVGISKTTHSTRSCSLASLALAGEDGEDEPSTSAAEMTDLDRLLSSSLADVSWSSSSGQAVRQLSPQGPDGRCTADTLQYSPSPWPTRPNTELAASASPWPQTRPVTELRNSETPGLQVQDTPSPFPQLISHSPSPFEATLLPGSALLEDGTSMLRPVSEDRTMPGSPLPDAAELDAEVRRSTSNLHLLAEQPVTNNGYCPQQVHLADSELRTMTTAELRKANNKLRSEIEGLQAELERRRTEVGVWSAALAAVSYGPSPISSRPGTRTESHPM